MKRKYIFVPWEKKHRVRAVMALFPNKRGMITYLHICRLPQCPYPDRTCHNCTFSVPQF